MDLTWADVCGRRLSRHGLVSPLPGGPAEAAAAMCGAHAQVLSAAEASIGLRLSGVTRSGVQKALWTEHSLVKTFGPRGTVHLLPTAELALWCGALGAVPTGRSAPQTWLSQEQTDELVAAMATVLADAELTVDELNDALADRVGPWAVEQVVPAFQTLWPRWRQVVEVAAHRGVVCFGHNKGRKVTYTSPVRWLPGFAPVPHSEGLGWLLDRYLRSYGPATPQHFARWLATTPAWAQSVFEAADLTEVSLEGGRAWVARDDAEPGPRAEGVLLLPLFDAFVVGSQPRELLFPAEARERALTRGQAGNFPVLLVDGVVEGVWEQKKVSGKVAVTVEPLRTLTAGEQSQLNDQVQRLGTVLEAKPTLTIGPVTVGAHA